MTNLLTLPNVVARRRRRAPTHRAPSATQLIVGLRPQSRAVVSGMIRSTGTVTMGSGFAFHFTLVDGSGELDVLFLGRGEMRGLLPGARVTVEGRVGSYDCKLALWNPRYRIEPAD
ncbi:MAG TPA: hypothetical protein VEH31_28710 [Streptosporangiaceae bacterium]|nr:hypothetical protein [Streptosporangiaceae bacterium]